MKVNFKNCKFNEFNPSFEIDFRGEKYKAIDVECVMDDGRIESHTIVHASLGLVWNKDEVWEDIDSRISYYADDDESVYDILETITGEMIVPNKKKFNVHYSFYLSDSIEIEAENEESAKDVVEKLICEGELGNLNEMDIGEQNIWID